MRGIDREKGAHPSIVTGKVFFPKRFDQTVRETCKALKSQTKELFAVLPGPSLQVASPSNFGLETRETIWVKMIGDKLYTVYQFTDAFQLQEMLLRTTDLPFCLMGLVTNFSSGYSLAAKILLMQKL